MKGKKKFFSAVLAVAFAVALIGLPTQAVAGGECFGKHAVAGAKTGMTPYNWVTEAVEPAKDFWLFHIPVQAANTVVLGGGGALLGAGVGSVFGFADALTGCTSNK